MDVLRISTDFMRVSSAVMLAFMSSSRRLICSITPSKRLTLLLGL